MYVVAEEVVHDAWDGVVLSRLQVALVVRCTSVPKQLQLWNRVRNKKVLTSSKDDRDRQHSSFLV